MNLPFGISHLHRYKAFTFAPWLANTSHSPLVNDTSSLTKHLKSSDESARERESRESEELIRSLATHKQAFYNVKHHMAAMSGNVPS